MLLKKWIYSLPFVVTQLVAVGYAHADIVYSPGGSGYVNGGAGYSAQASYGLSAAGSLAGSGYWGGAQGCPYKTKTSKAAVDETDDNKREKQAIKKLEGEADLEGLKRDRSEKKLELLAKKINTYFDSDVAEFLISTHMDKMNKCEDYRSFPGNNCPVPNKPGVTSAPVDANGNEVGKDVIAKCDGLDTVPDLLKDKWTRADGTAGYCAATSKSSAGNIASSICSDKTLQPSDKPKYRTLNPHDCATALSDYRKERIAFDKAADLAERKKQEAEDRAAAMDDKIEMAKLERETKMKDKLEGGTDCVNCNSRTYEKPERDWWSTVANVVGGIGLIQYGKSSDAAAREYNAQLGFPSTNSYGYPYVTAGVYSVINGLAGPGAYGCAGGVGGSGFPLGAGGYYGGLGNLGYGPNANLGGAFGYPQGLYGAPWGGGMYQPGFGLNGGLAGPNGGWPYGLTGQAGIGAPLNGQFGIPASAGWQTGAFGSPLNAQLGIAVNGQIGIPASGFQGLGIAAAGFQGLGVAAGGFQGLYGAQIGSQYQMQMLQQQQAMLQAQAQQQAQMAQYYQAQAQAQMQAVQRQQMVQQQAAQVQQEIASLQMRLQMLVSGAYTGSSTYTDPLLYGSGSLGLGGSLYGGGSLGTAIGGVGSLYIGAAASYSTPYYNTVGTAATLPGIGTGVTIGTPTRGR